MLEETGILILENYSRRLLSSTRSRTITWAVSGEQNEIVLIQSEPIELWDIAQLLHKLMNVVVMVGTQLTSEPNEHSDE